MRRLLPTSLTARLTVTVVLLVALVSLVIAALTTAAISDHLTDQLDQELAESHERSVDAFRDGPPPVAPPEGAPPGGPEVRGQDAGTLSALLPGEGPGTDSAASPSGWVIEEDGTLRPLDQASLDLLAGLAVGDSAQQVELPGIGDYRVLVSGVDGAAVVTGLPTASVAATVESLIGWEALFCALGVLAAGVIAALLVRRQLRPLREVAVTADEVTGLDLTTGEVGVTARVPERLVDSRTEVGQVALALNTLLGHVERALESRYRSEQQVRQFVADASHELRTPLATISGYAELGLRDPEPERLTHAMGKVRVEAGRMTSLVEDLLLLARLDSGRPLEREEVDLTRLVMESVADARVTGADHRWRMELPEVAVTVPGDELRLHQVLTNLLSNARRHTPAGTTVVTAVVVGDATVTLTVTDDGPGIPPDLLPEVFTRFARGDAARSRDASGAGLGLALARAIALAHGGDLSVTSQPGRTCFALTLPR